MLAEILRLKPLAKEPGQYASYIYMQICSYPFFTLRSVTSRYFDIATFEEADTLNNDWIVLLNCGHVLVTCMRGHAISVHLIPIAAKSGSQGLATDSR